MRRFPRDGLLPHGHLLRNASPLLHPLFHFHAYCSRLPLCHAVTVSLGSVNLRFLQAPDICPSQGSREAKRSALEPRSEINTETRRGGAAVPQNLIRAFQQPCDPQASSRLYMACFLKRSHACECKPPSCHAHQGNMLLASCRGCTPGTWDCCWSHNTSVLHLIWPCSQLLSFESQA